MEIQCPLPIPEHSRILLAHGGGGRLMHELIQGMFAAAFSNPILNRRHDAAVLPDPGKRLAFTTDSFVVRPLFFPGGDIGSMAVYGTVNDLAMSGARPTYLSVAFILEEGLPVETLRRVVSSMRRAASLAGVEIVTGDTKVVEAGKGDGLYLTTTGMGIVEHELDIDPSALREDDAVLVSGDIGRHGMAVMALREGLEFESRIESDSAPVAAAVMELVQAGVQIHCFRDITRGGLAGTLNEIADASGLTIRIEETEILVRQDVRAACEILGLDVLQVACEGRFVAFIPEGEAGRALEVLSRHEVTREARRIGTVTATQPGGVVLSGFLGADRPLPMPAGEQLPRIC